MRILVVAPHPDDEVLGCGGVIGKYAKQGDEVFLCIATKGYTPDWSEQFLKDIKKEIKESCRILGIKETFFLGFPTAKLDTISQKELNDAISDMVRNIKPDVIYSPSGGDLNRDHRCVFEAVLVASRPKPGSFVKQVLCYEVLSETEWGMPLQAFVPMVYEDIGSCLKDKIGAMEAYKSQVKEFPHPRSIEVIEALARKRGSECGMEAAEAFVLIRSIN
ncbi:MAG: PIG-L family deacetylase [Candidatus Wildermuthbacteria bacterium]|nr:PIG-L family deacetylase [Candidatus Wildermuthbacteria bacterium]